MKTPIQFWSLMLCVLGVALAIVGYCFPGTDQARHDLFFLANTLISAGAGAFTGNAVNHFLSAPGNVPPATDHPSD